MKAQRLQFAALIVVILIFYFPLRLQAQAGFPDPSFGVDGEVLTGLTEWYGDMGTEGRCMAIQSDGKIIVAGSASFELYILRYFPNGSLDSSFGPGGIVDAHIGCDALYGCGIAIQPDGKIVVAGKTSGWGDGDFAIARFTINGTADSSFGIEGIDTTTLECEMLPNHAFTSVLIQPDGKIVAAGTSQCFEGDMHSKFALVRYNEDGSLDDSFGDGGIVLKELGLWGSSSNNGFSLAIQPDNKLIMAGWADTPYSGHNFTLMRWNNDGSDDTTFGEGGSVCEAIGDDEDEFAYSIALQTDGKILAAGSFETTSDSLDYAIARYNSDGSIDTNFGTGGFVIRDFGRANEEARSIALQSDGKIIVAGFSGSDDDSIYEFCTARFNSDGSIDNSFGTDGFIKSDFGSTFSLGYSVKLQDDGNILVAGFSTEGFSVFTAIARYTSCSAYFTLYPDVTPHLWNAVNLATGNEPIEYLWEWGDGSTSTEPYPSHTYADSGYYSICLTINDAAGCSSTYCDSSTFIYRINEEQSMVTVNVTNGTTTIVEPVESNLRISPNPFSDELIIYCEYNEIQFQATSIDLFDLTGHKLFSQPINSPETIIDTSELSPGIYFVSCLIGEKLTVLKVTKI